MIFLISPHERESKIVLDPGLLGFRIPWAVYRIPDPTSKIFTDFGFRKQKFPIIPECYYMGRLNSTSTKLLEMVPPLLRLFLLSPSLIAFDY